MSIENTANTTLAVSSGASLISAINSYATIISLTITALGVIAGIIFHLLALLDRRKQAKLNAEHRLKESEKIVSEDDELGGNCGN